MNLTNWNFTTNNLYLTYNSSIASGPGAAKTGSYPLTIDPSKGYYTTSNVTYNTDYSTIEIGIETLSFGLMNVSMYYCSDNYACYYESVLPPD